MAKGKKTGGRDFSKGKSGNPAGRPVGSGKQYTKDQCWKSLSLIVWLLFDRSEQDMVEWLKNNIHTLSRAEKVLLEKSKDIRVIESILDRIIGRPGAMTIEPNAGHRIQFVSQDELNEAK